ncbi:MAG: nitrogenase component 1 [Chitinivibrionales bacterium]
MTVNARKTETPHVATQNTCKLCAPLGASLAFKGIQNAISLLHGSQGCSTYIRRYMIGHFREPVDIASSSFDESTAIFGGREQFITSIKNLITQYSPSVIGVATTCLAETIGEDVAAYIREYASTDQDSTTDVIGVNTPSFRGTHVEGFTEAVCSIVDRYAKPSPPTSKVVLLPGMVSPADLRHVKDVVEQWDLDTLLLPDYSDTLDGGAWDAYHKLPSGGTSVEELRTIGGARAAVEFDTFCSNVTKPSSILAARCGCSTYMQPLPIGLDLTDRYMEYLSLLSGIKMPEKIYKTRMRLVDSYIDGHKYLFGKKAVVYGDPGLVYSLCSFLSEIGVDVVLCATGTMSQRFTQKMLKLYTGRDVEILDDADFEYLARRTEVLKPDIVIGNSKGYSFTSKLGIPLVRAGFPIQDRIGSQRIQHLLYDGTQQLFDRIVNTIIENVQNNTPTGYLTY